RPAGPRRRAPCALGRPVAAGDARGAPRDRRRDRAPGRADGRPRARAARPPVSHRRVPRAGRRGGRGPRDRSLGADRRRAAPAALSDGSGDVAGDAGNHGRPLPYADRLGIVGAGLACWGSISSYLGLLASALGRVADATRHFEEAAKVHERIGARPFLAWTQLSHARLLLTGDAGARRAEATALLASALATARELGMDGLVAKMRGLGLESAATAGGQEPADGDAVFRNEGDFWTVAYAGKAVRLRHGKGLGDIAILLAN